MRIVKYRFPQHGDDRGMLVALEACSDIPFDIKRVYYMYDTKDDVTRGYHAHRTLEEILFCVHGSCTVTLDDGREREPVRLDIPYEGLYVGAGIWREMSEFSEGAVLMVLAADYYKPEDYIRDYSEFKAFVETDGNAPVSTRGIYR